MDLFGIAVFPGVSAWGFAALAVIYFIASFVKGTLGFGAMPPLIIFGAWVLDPHHAVLLAVTTNAATQLQFISEARRDADWKTARPVILGFAVALVAGLWAFGKLEPGLLTILLGFGLGGMIAADFFGWLGRLVERVGPENRMLGPVISVIAGLMAGVTGAGGVILLSLYFKLKIPDPRTFRATSLLMATVVLVWRVIGLLVVGLLTVPLLAETALILPVSALGAWVGSRYSRRLDAKRYFGAFRVVLMVGAVTLIWKGLAGLF